LEINVVDSAPLLQVNYISQRMQSSWEASVNTLRHGMVFKVTCDGAYVSVSYGCSYTALLVSFFLFFFSSSPSSSSS
jgi:hypothetical protein